MALSSASRRAGEDLWGLPADARSHRTIPPTRHRIPAGNTACCGVYTIFGIRITGKSRGNGKFSARGRSRRVTSYRNIRDPHRRRRSLLSRITAIRTEGGELFQQAYAEGNLNVFGHNTIAIETEGEHAAQGGAIAHSVCGKRVVNFTSGQGIVYGVEQYYHAPGKCSTMVLEVGARALTKHALNVHCGHDDIYGALDTGWIMIFGKDAQQTADQALILRRVTELSLTPGMNIMDGFLTSHLERTFYKHESELIREYLGAPEDMIDTPTEAQRTLFGPKRRRVPAMIDLANPLLLGPVQNQEHYMQGIVARRNNFMPSRSWSMLEEAYKDFGALTGRYYGLLSEYKCEDAETVFVSLGSAAENIEAAVDYLRETRGASVGSIHVNVIRPFPEAAIVKALKGKKNVIILERTDEGMSGDNPLGRDIRTALNKALQGSNLYSSQAGTESLPALDRAEMPQISSPAPTAWARATSVPSTSLRFEYATAAARARMARRWQTAHLHRAGHRSSLCGEFAGTAVTAAGGRGCGALPLDRRMGRDHHRQEPGRDSGRSQRHAL
jgi:pyruvate/2-oxoacid:ferredoxin oxidoreductase alpha subunit